MVDMFPVLRVLGMLVMIFASTLLLPMGVTPDGWLMPLLSPGLATDLLKAVIQGGMAAAELELNIGTSTVSRHIKDLEGRLGRHLN